MRMERRLWKRLVIKVLLAKRSTATLLSLHFSFLLDIKRSLVRFLCLVRVLPVPCQYIPEEAMENPPGLGHGHSSIILQQEIL